MDVDGMARAGADVNDLPGTSATVGGGGGDNDGRQGWTLTGKGREPARADGQRTRAGGNDNVRRGRTLTGKGREPATTTTAGKGGR